MISLEDARSIVLDGHVPLSSETVPLLESLGLVLAKDIISCCNVPAFVNSAMDGYALNSSDTKEPGTRLQIAGITYAGMPPGETLMPGTCQRIMTGAPIPKGSDAVCIQELTHQASSVCETVVIEAVVSKGDNVRQIGEDISEGSVLFEKNTKVTSTHIGVLASIGIGKVEVIRRPIVGVLSTGDELSEIGDPSLDGKIWDSNRYSLIAALKEIGAEPVDLGLIKDDLHALREHITEAGRKCDLILTSGGASVGDADFISEIIADLCGSSAKWMKVMVKPGKPLAYGILSNSSTPILGLPGNPVAALISFRMFARPLIRKLMGIEPQIIPTWTGIADEDFPRHIDGKLHIDRARVAFDDQGELRVSRSTKQGSHQLSAMAYSNALIYLEDGIGIKVGDRVKIELLDWESIE
ncbi:MAG: molybdopterin molybdotransferase MoeA [Acidimicrobiales bacterium]|nr:molybdopterin molybdotransferase MoeA [Acidimicrobiales bacterium]